MNQRENSSSAYPLLSIVLLAAVGAAVLTAGVLGWRYWKGQWAPSRWDGGLTFAESPVFYAPDGRALAAEQCEQLVQLCATLRSTSRELAERGGEIRFDTPGATSGVLTVYPEQNVIFLGSWMDAKTLSMRGQRAPCFRVSRELMEFLDTHGLLESS